METGNSEKLTLTRISAAAAAGAFQVCTGLDPDGFETPGSAAADGECLRVAGTHGAVITSVNFSDGVAWILAAAGGAGQRPMLRAFLGKMESVAAERGCRVLAFQTVRPGLKRVAQKQGYSVERHNVRGWVIWKEF